MKNEIRTGTIPELNAIYSAHGRIKILSAGGHYYLYIPEIKQLFAISKELDGLSDARISEIMSRNINEILSKHRHKYPSRKQDDDNRLKDVVIHVSQKCNLNCIYCYASDLIKNNSSMAVKLVDKIISQTLSLSKYGLSSVKFLGGEPTLAWHIIERFVKEYKSKSLEKKVSPPQFVIVTNGTIITRRIIDFAHENDIFIWVSLDGPQEIHDQLRPTISGHGSYIKASEAIKKLVHGGVRVGVESVFTKLHFSLGITPQDLIDHSLSLGVREIQISPTVGIWHCCDIIEEIREVSVQFEEAARKGIRSYRTQNPYLLRGIDFILRGFISQTSEPYICGAGRTFMAINYDGEAFPCYLLESPSTSYGYIGETYIPPRYEQVRKRFANNSKAHHSECRKCWANEICKSCLGTSYQISKEISKPPEWFCFFQKSIISGVLGEIAYASESREWGLFMQNLAATFNRANNP
jgi:uncharacterized protein